jgi:hypothetical protein
MGVAMTGKIGVAFWLSSPFLLTITSRPPCANWLQIVPLLRDHYLTLSLLRAPHEEEAERPAPANVPPHLLPTQSATGVLSTPPTQGESMGRMTFWLGVIIGFVGFHVVYALGFAVVWWTKVRKDGDIPEQVQGDFTRVREALKRPKRIKYY